MLGYARKVAAADPREIDTINIHQASLRAMQRAILMLALLTLRWSGIKPSNRGAPSLIGPP